jgi:hypothetical protein
MPIVTEEGAVKKGVRRDLANTLLYVDQQKTPFKSAIKKGEKPKNKLVEWPADDYDEPKSEGVISGKDATEFEGAFDGYGLLSNYVQKFRRTVAVDDMDEEISDIAGIGQKKLMGKAIAKKMISFARDKEFTFLGDNDAQPQGAGKPYQTRGALQWAKAHGESSICPIPEQYTTPAGCRYTGTLSNFNEQTFTDMAQARYDEVGMGVDMTGWIGTSLANHMAQWTSYMPDKANHQVIRSHESKANTLTRKVPIIETEWGNYKFICSNFINVGDDRKSAASKRLGFFCDMATMEERETRTGGFKRLEDGGGGPRGFIDGISCLVAKNPVDLMLVQPSGA